MYILSFGLQKYYFPTTTNYIFLYFYSCMAEAEAETLEP